MERSSLKVAGKGKSFKGAAAYYLHDKQAATAGRVAFTHTVNLPTQDAGLAWRVMARTAANQNQIKAAAGAARTGRKLENPVYVYSLSWAPDEKPLQTEMIEAGYETLKALGLEEHQVVMVAHNDEPHPHIHPIVDRVHPETGLAAKLSKDHLALSRWAEDYEKRQGQIRCEQRPINNERRREAFVRDRNRARHNTYHKWRREQASQATERRQRELRELAARHRERRLQSARKEAAAIAEKRGMLREQADALWWSALYRQQRREREKIRLQQFVARTNLREALKRNSGLLHAAKDSRSGHLRQAFQSVTKSEAALMKLKHEHKLERVALAERLREIERDEIRKIGASHQEKEEKLRRAEIDERYRLETRHSRDSKEAAQRIADGRDRLAFETGSAFRRAASKSGSTRLSGTKAAIFPSRLSPPRKGAARRGAAARKQLSLPGFQKRKAHRPLVPETLKSGPLTDWPETNSLRSPTPSRSRPSRDHELKASVVAITPVRTVLKLRAAIPPKAIHLPQSKLLAVSSIGRHWRSKSAALVKMPNVRTRMIGIAAIMFLEGSKAHAAGLRPSFSTAPQINTA